ncbi:MULTISPECIES: DNA-processing protein DprA [Pacificimonas]|uniref:DNA-processing protein DprA n=1 Tax=Pacificimonas TaxID=1960290 RepID=UPI001CCB6C82|nr:MULTISPECIES: DNA-processing protein DprA [Pacificimonas]
MVSETGASEQLSRLRLARTPRIGPVTYRQLLARFGTADLALDALPELARRGGGKPLRPPPVARVQEEIDRTAEAGASFIFYGDEAYPRRLANIETAPPVLACRGRLDLAHERCVAIVGARNASAAAIRFTRDLSAELAGAGFTVVSGLARGIDAAAHQGALGGGTVGVIAGGIDICWPPENAGLHQELYERGLVVAEQPFGMEPRAAHFPRRNRIISGLSLGTVVMEAAPRSGSLITARLSNEQGREVMAVPGFPLDPRARGCNALIRDGATLVQSVEDIVETLQPLSSGAAVKAEPPTYVPAPHEEVGDRERDLVAGLLALTPVPVDELVRLSGLSAATVSAVLLELELGGRLERHAGNRVSSAA